MKDGLIVRLSSKPNLYDFIVELFKYITDCSTAKEIRKKYSSAMKQNISEVLNLIEGIANELLIINPYEFGAWLEIWLESFYKTKIDGDLFCFLTLQKIDNIFEELLRVKRTIENKGPLNSDSEYKLYRKNRHAFWDEVFTNGRIRKGRQTVEFGVNSLNKEFNNFDVLRNTSLFDYNLQVKGYNRELRISSTMKVGVIPFSNNVWFDVNKDEMAQEFEVHYESQDLNEHNKLLKKQLIECEKQKCEVVVFPELAMNPETEKEIRDFVILSDFQYVKLIFLGSVWNNKCNEAVLMSSQGTVLIREEKNCQYSFYDKEQKCIYYENIEPKKNIEFIDVNGIGRIAYLICADVNEEEILAICAIMHVDFMFVSAFTSSTDLMMKTACDRARRKGVTTILCNSCAAIDNDKIQEEYISFGVVPKIVEKSLVAKMVGEKHPCVGIGRCDICVKTLLISRD